MREDALSGSHRAPVLADAPDGPPGLRSRLARIAREEMGDLSPRLWLAGLLMRFLPEGAAGRLRAQVYRAAGLAIGPHTLITGPLTLAASSRASTNLRVGARCFVNRQVFIDVAAPVTLGDGVSVGHHSVLVTTDHALGGADFRAGQIQAAPITIENGAWIAAGVTLLPGVTVGAGAVVAAGAVVTKDVPPHTLVGGVPARFIRRLEPKP